MLSSTLLRAFTTPVTYVLVLILLGTAIMQVRYVNKALQRFDSTQVIPIQFVSFTLCVIIGSAVLYRDFERTTGEQAIKFVGGCFLTFFGVFLITSGRPSADEEEETLSDDEGIVDTIRLPEQEPNAPPSPGQARHRGSNAGGSRRSSRVSFMDSVNNKPLAVVAENGVPSSRSPSGAASRTSLLPTGDGIESAPLHRTPSREPPVHPGIQQALSSESAVTISSATPVPSEPASHVGTPSAQNPAALSMPHEPNSVATRTCSSASRSRPHPFSGPLFSPSPFDSTVRGLVSSALLQDSPSAKRPPSRRRLSRPSIRSSLYVSQDELDEDYFQQGEEGHPAATMSAVERSRTVDSAFHSGSPAAADGHLKTTGVRSRTRSFSHTFGEIFGVRRKADDNSPLLIRPGDEEGPTSTRRQTNYSTETL